MVLVYKLLGNEQWKMSLLFVICWWLLGYTTNQIPTKNHQQFPMTPDASTRGTRATHWLPHAPLLLEECPTSWDDLRAWLRRSLYNQQPLAIAWSKPNHSSPEQIWLTLVGIAKYLSRTNQTVTRVQILEKLGIKDQTLHLGFKALKFLGFTVKTQERYLLFTQHSIVEPKLAEAAIAKFLAVVREEQFQREYFAEVPLATIQAITAQAAIG